ncbi:zinc metallopeptidase [Seongchinamella sediminis]|uniref:Zinc metallopeptidase n=1 Tax=Seongchinamella sediminis TaxID=2283635 RepID=A0A3L7DYL3_9GAMM|nr:zinc metallopeptidase [Seongchinamella sediminis]RLQ21749.1 zinc metallopeptidase [Seongchinamella sediminis]
MITIIVVLALLAVISLPGVWVRRILRNYSEPADRYRERGSGAELARHLLDQLDLRNVVVEVTPDGDHYDPQARAVRLTEDKYHGHSLTAVTVAAHEVGHAIQDARDEVLFRNRQRLARVAAAGQRVGSLFLLAAPLAMLVTRTPGFSFLLLWVAIGSMLLGTVVHLLTLPVEFDASFNKALPLLESGKHLYEGDLPHARRILKAAALTYVAASLASLLNLGRWLAILRR